MDKKYYKHKLENLLVVSKIVVVHYFEFDKSFVSHTESHDFWELVYAVRGDIYCVVDGVRKPVKEGEVIFHKPGVVHSTEADGKRAPNVFIVAFECKNQAMSFFEDRQEQLDKRLLHFIYSIIEESKSTFDLPYSDPLLKKMRLLPEPALGGQQLIKNYLELLLINIMRGVSKKENPEAVFLPQKKYDELISDRVIEYMKNHITERLSVSDICSILHYNKSYVFRQFKKTTGSSLMAYFMKMKIEYAKVLLREVGSSVSLISERLSFENPNYFSKAFKKITGYTPSAYRKIKKGIK